MDTARFEKRVIESFYRVKSDMMGIWNTIYQIKHDQQAAESRVGTVESYANLDRLELNHMKKSIERLERSQDNLRVTLAGIMSVMGKGYIYNKSNKKLHDANCRHAKRIKHENRMIVESRAEVKGYNKCVCMGA